MCTVVVLRRPDSDWPLLLAANRDEMVNRRCKPPARHWSDRPRVVAGLDELAGGTWLGVNDDGVTAGVLNRRNTLGPLPGSRSRGELPLRALDHGTARLAVRSLGALDANAYRPFNMIVADSHDAFWVRCRQAESDAHVIETGEIPPGLSMVTAYDLNDTSSPRIGRFLARFQAASVPDPVSGDWSPWTAILASREHDSEAGPGGAMCVVTDFGFETVSSSLIALPAEERREAAPIWLFSLGRPGETAYTPVAL
jgi:uncharacterized protein with NRDE domain